MKNPCLTVALSELERAGIRSIEQTHGSKHLQLRWVANGHGLRVYTLPTSPGDWRSQHNVRAEIRRMLREDGVLTTPERPEPPPRPAPKPVDRLGEIERRLAALEESVHAIQTRGVDQ